MRNRKTFLRLDLLAVLGAAMILAGCAGRSEMRSVASQSSAILNAAQINATKYAEAQTRYEAGAQASIAAFNKMTAIGNQEQEAVQGTWIDSTMRGLYGELGARTVDDYEEIVNDATAAPVAPTVITIDTTKVRQAVAKLNELAKEETLQSQVAFLANFAQTVASAYQDAQKKAADMANGAAGEMKKAAPIQQ
jgi:hypothetical protein